ncbi:hypothetical protein J4443_00060 [Candidatus Woesearchaeota archaeon]|nr:hypothetical protein [Candidatus Woesearchaeota archaeon]
MKKNKKGNVHIDWVISIAIFLTYIIVLLAFIKPSYKPSFEGDVLVGLVKDSFHDEAEWEVKKILLSFDCDNGGVYDFSLGDYIPDLTGRFKVVNAKTENIASYTGSLKIKLNNHDDKFWVFYNDLEGYPDAVDPGDKSLGMECESPPEYNIGAANPIVFKGISERKLDNLNVSKIEEKFPEFRQFKISVLSSKGELKDSYCFVKGRIGKLSRNECDQTVPPADVVVYGVNLGDAILDRDANLEQIILNIQVW